MKTRNGTEVPEGRPSGIPGASRKAAARRDRKTGEPAKRPGKPASPETARGASPSAAPPAARRGRKAGEPAKRQDKPASPEAAKGASPSAASPAARRERKTGDPAKRPDKPKDSAGPMDSSPSATPAAAARMRRDGTMGRRARSGGDAARNGSVFALALLRAEPDRQGTADRASPGFGDPEADLRRILLENCSAESGPAGSGGGGSGDRKPSRTGRRGSTARGRSLADFLAGGGGVRNPDLERLLGSVAGQAPSRRSGGAEGPAGLSERWRDPLSGVPDPRQVREALDVFVKLKLRRGLRELAKKCEDPTAFGVGHMLWSLAHRGILVNEAAAFVMLRKVFGADSGGDADGSGDALPCNRRTAIHAMRQAGLLDPALSAGVIKPANVMPDFHDVLAAVVERLRVPAREIVGKCRRRQTIAARFAVMAVQREIAGATYARIGRDMGGRHHSSAAHAVADVARRRRWDPKLDRVLKACADSADDAVLRRHVDMLRGAH